MNPGAFNLDSYLLPFILTIWARVGKLPTLEIQFVRTNTLTKNDNYMWHTIKNNIRHTILHIFYGGIFTIRKSYLFVKISCVRVLNYTCISCARLHNISRFFQNIMIFGRAWLLFVLGRCLYGHIVKIHYFFEKYSSQVTTVVVQLVKAFTSHGESREFDTRQRQI